MIEGSGLLRHLTSVARYALFPLLSMPQNRKGLTNAAVADFSYATEEFVCLVEIMNGRLQDEVVLPLPTRYIVDLHCANSYTHAFRVLQHAFRAYQGSAFAYQSNKACLYTCFHFVMVVIMRTHIVVWGIVV